ncbi:FAD-binding protein, partial [Acinetobacter baumannii]
RAGLLAGAMPQLVVRPADAGEVAKVVRLAKERNIRLIPYGNGSGVLGGAIPLGGEVMLDLRRLDGIVSINATDAMVTVRA